MHHQPIYRLIKIVPKLHRIQSPPQQYLLSKYYTYFIKKKKKKLREYIKLIGNSFNYFYLLINLFAVIIPTHSTNPKTRV